MSPLRGHLGLNALNDPGNPVADIIAVHGLGGHRENTWTSAHSNKMWLRDFLPKDVPEARIMTYGYDSGIFDTITSNKQPLYSYASDLLARLSLYRRRTRTERCPIIFVAHSLGGIIVKSALIHASLAAAGNLEDYKAIKLSTYAVLFFGTPHQGAPIASWGKLLANVLRVVSVGHVSGDVLHHLVVNSEWLQQQLSQYAFISNDFVTKFFYENIRPVVPASSAVVLGQPNTEAIGINAGHCDMVRYRSRKDDAYQVVSTHLLLLCRDAKAVVESNWAQANAWGKLFQIKGSSCGPCPPEAPTPEPTDVGKLVAESVQEFGFANDQHRTTTELLQLSSENDIVWAKLACDELKNFLSGRTSYNDRINTATREAANLPQGRGPLLERIFQRIYPTLPHSATSILRAMALVFRPLTLRELAVVAGLAECADQVERTRSHIKQCSPFALIQREEGEEKVAFADQEVRDFLQQKLFPLRSLTRNDLEEIDDETQESEHSKLATRCFRYVCSGALHHRYPGRPPPLEYPIVYWMEHGRLSSDDIADIFDANGEFFQPNSRVRDAWLHNYCLISSSPVSITSGFTLSHLAVFSGILPLMNRMLRFGKVDHRSCLLVAASKGDKVVVEELLKGRGSDDELHGFALCAAIQGGHDKLALELLKGPPSALLANLPKVPVPVDTKLLRAASLKGFSALVELLLEIDTDHQRAVFRQVLPIAALHAAAVGGHHELMRQLLGGVDNRVDWKPIYGNIIEVASAGGHKETVDLLLKSKIDGGVKSEDLAGALQMAASGGHESVVRILLESIQKRKVEEGREGGGAKDGGERVNSEKAANSDGAANGEGGGDSGEGANNEEPLGGEEVPGEKRKGDGEGENDVEQTNAREEPLRAEANGEGEANDGEAGSCEKGTNGEEGANDELGQDGEEEQKGFGTALVAAAAGGNTAIAALLSNNQDLKDQDGEALGAAARKGHLRMVQFLMGKMEYSSKQLSYAFQSATTGGHSMIAMIISQKNPNSSYHTALEAAVSRGHEQTVDLLLSKYTPKPLEISKCLSIAARRGHTTVAGSLWERLDKAEKKDAFENALEAAASSSRGDVVELLFKKGGNDRSTVGKALKTAAIRGCESIVRFLTKREHNPEVKESALRKAACKGHLSVVVFLVGENVNINKPGGKKGRNAVTLAAAGGHLETVGLLLGKLDESEKEKILNDAGPDKRTAFHLAAEQGQLEMVEFLAGKRVNKEARDINGRTALHLAATGGLREMVELLEKKGADMNAVDNNGLTPIDAARIVLKELDPTGTDSEWVRSQITDLVQSSERIRKPPEVKVPKLMYIPDSTRFTRELVTHIYSILKSDTTVRGWVDPTELLAGDRGIWLEGREYPLLVAEGSCELDRKNLAGHADQYIRESAGAIRVVIGVNIVRRGGEATVMLWRAPQHGSGENAEFRASPEMSRPQIFRNKFGRCRHRDTLELRESDFIPEPNGDRHTILNCLSDSEQPQQITELGGAVKYADGISRGPFAIPFYLLYRWLNKAEGSAGTPLSRGPRA